MKTIVIGPDEIDEAAIAPAAAVVASGGIVAYPTDTFYGLGVNPRNAIAVEKLFAAKGREPSQPSPLIAASAEQAEEAVLFNDVGRLLAAHFWPGPLSLVLPAHSAIHASALGGRTTAAVRVPAHPIARALARRSGFCITATSANLSGDAPVHSAPEIGATLLASIDVVIDAGPTPGAAPSTIVDVTDGTPRLVRAGAIAWNRVLESLK